jgi:hypothetical protein
MIHNFTQLHHSISQRLGTVLSSRWVSGKSAKLCDTIVDYLLPPRKFHFDNKLRLGRQLFFYLRLDSAQEERSEDLM